MLVRVNSIRADPTAHLGAVVMLGFAAWAGWRWVHSGLLFFLLLLFRDIGAAWFLSTRCPVARRHEFGRPELIAYVSSGLPLFYLPAMSSHGLVLNMLSGLLPIAGFSLATIALFDLGDSFGIAPANRGRVGGGVYRVLRHPMYTGYAIAEFGIVLMNPLNVVIWGVSIMLYRTRALMETTTLELGE